MVRLREVRLLDKISVVDTFQFLYGSIERAMLQMYAIPCLLFQFLYGSIERGVKSQVVPTTV